MTPVLRYRDPAAAARWLCEAFGFREHVRTREGGGQPGPIELGLGDSSVVVSPVAHSAFDGLMIEPSAVGGRNTHVLYLSVADAQAHYARARAAGARIEIDPQDDGSGGRFYACRDLEGHLWSFGTRRYGPSGPERAHIAPAPAKRSKVARSLGVLGAAAALAAGWMLYAGETRHAAEPGTATVATAARNTDMTEQLAVERSRRQTAEAAAAKAAEDLTSELARRRAAEAASLEAAARLAGEQTRRLAAESASADASQTLSAAARQTASKLEAELTEERRLRQQLAGDLASANVRLVERTQEVAREREAKEHAVRALASSQRLLDEQTSARVRAEAEAAAIKAEAARDHGARVAAATSGNAETAALREQVAELARDKRAQSGDLEALRSEIAGLRAANEDAKARAAASTQAAAAETGALRQQLAAAHDALEAARSQLASVRAEREDTEKAASMSQVASVAPETPAAAVAAAAPTALAAARATTPCARAVQGKVRLGPRGSRVWTEGSLTRLCRGAETTVEPARCFDALMRGKVKWGTGSTWTTPNALILCGGTHNARQTLDCFTNSIAANDTWAAAIDKCRTAAQ